MNIYRLAAIDSRHASWRFSSVQDTVWACAPDAQAARDLVTAKTNMPSPNAQEGKAPWEDEAVTSCLLDPTMSLMRAGTVVRQDGSEVGD